MRVLNFLFIRALLCIFFKYNDKSTSIATDSSQSSKCFNNVNDLGKIVKGSWLEYNFTSNNNTYFLSRSTDKNSWFETACPSELLTSSCFYRGFTDKAIIAENKKFITSDCSLDEFNATKFLELLSNRKVVFCFDGIAKQFWSYLTCKLRLFDKTEFHMNWEDSKDTNTKLCLKGPQHCKFSLARVYFPTFKTTFIYQHIQLHSKMSHRKFDIIGFFKSLNLSPNDLVVANFGHNFHSDGNTYRNFLRKFSDDYEYALLKMKNEMPVLIWMETSPQHFPNSSNLNGYYEASIHKDGEFKCSPYANTSSYTSNDIRNIVSNDVMKGASIPILRIAYSTISQFDVHLEGIDLRGHYHNDCTHFCSNAAIFGHWTDLLYNNLPILFFPSNLSSVDQITSNSNSLANNASSTSQSQLKSKFDLSFEILDLFANISRNLIVQNNLNSIKYKKYVAEDKLSGIYLTTGKDLLVFKKSALSAMERLKDIHTFFVICPNAKGLEDSLSTLLGDRVIFVDESSFPLTFDDVATIMIETVKQIGLYPLKNGKSLFEHTVWTKLGWYFQQVVKLYAGEFLGIEDFVILDSDIIWFTDIFFKNATNSRFNYAYSSQWHPSYRSTMKIVLGIDHTKGPYMSGICHHMVILKKVIDKMKEDVLKMHSLPLWGMMLNASAREMTCRAPKTGICGGGSTLSEYDIYFHYARQKYPETVNIRQLKWANGPKPGMLYNPPSDGKLHPDSFRDIWLDHKANEKEDAFVKQIHADASQGYDFVAYHNYGKRRYYELVHTDIDRFCGNYTRPNPNVTTCSWINYTNKTDLDKSWWEGCLCYNLMNRVA